MMGLYVSDNVDYDKSLFRGKTLDPFSAACLQEKSIAMFNM